MRGGAGEGGAGEGGGRGAGGGGLGDGGGGGGRGEGAPQAALAHEMKPSHMADKADLRAAHVVTPVRTDVLADGQSCATEGIRPSPTAKSAQVESALEPNRDSMLLY